jgi:hypothetical protein
MSDIPKYTFEKLCTDREIAECESEFFDLEHYHTIIDSDADGYKANGDVLFKFRAGVIPTQFCDDAVDSLRSVSMVKHDNRGASAGVLDWKRMPKYVGGWVNSDKFRTYYTRKTTNKVSKHHISNLTPSNLIGYYERRDRNDLSGRPCRMTAFTKKETEKWHRTVPIIERIDQLFQELYPERHARQLARASLTPEVVIGGTCFSTVTTNYSWRTALHRDRGDYDQGFGTLAVLCDSQNPNEYDGCYMGFPQYGVCINVRHTDFLLMDVHEWHANTEFIPLSKPKPYRRFAQRDFENHWHLNRLALVCYLRKNMIKCQTSNSTQTTNKIKSKKPI